MANTEDTVTTKILLEAAKALRTLLELSQGATSVKTKIDLATAAVQNFAKKTGLSFAQSKKAISDLDAEFSKMDNSLMGTTTSSSVFGDAGKEAWNKVGKGAEEAENKVKKGSQGILGSLNVVRLAVGILASMFIRDLISAIGAAFKEGIENARKFELALYNLTNAERILSKQGIDISPEDLRDTIDALQELLPTISRIDATNAVSQIAIFTKGLGLTKEQIKQLTQVTAVLATKNAAAGLSFQQVFDQLKTGLLTGTTRGLTDLGVTINAGAVNMEALKVAGVKTTAEYNKLNDTLKEQYQAQAILNILYTQSQDELGTINEYLETNDAKLKANKASWEDLLAVLGQGFANLIPDVSAVTEEFQKSLEVGGIKKLFTNAGEARKELDKFGLASKSIMLKLGFGVALTRKEYELLKKTLSTLSQDEILKIFPDPSAIKDRFTRELVESLVTIEDTATGVGAALDEAFGIDTTAAQAELKDLLKDLENLKEKMDDKEEDFGIDLGRFDEDALRDRQRAEEDYNQNVQQATRAAALSKKEANEKYRQKELEDERKFQENMRKLQEDFLYNLEDALRERDARQVLRLIDKYNMEKEAMINENALRKTAAEENKKIEEAERQAQLDEKLRVMAEDQALKMSRMDEDSAQKRERMVQDHELEMARLREQLEERILEAAHKMAEEYGINEEGALAIFDLLSQYYGTDGSLAQLTSQGYAAMLSNAEGFLTALTGIIGQYNAIMAQAATSPFGELGGGGFQHGGVGGAGQYGQPGGNIGPPAPGYAKGGQFVATRPRQILVGEGSEDELVTITPLSQLKGKSGTSGANGLGGMNGQTQISVSVDLSPDLEARVVNKSLDGMSDVISKVRRAK